MLADTHCLTDPQNEPGHHHRIGEPGCRIEEGVLKGRVDWEAGRAYVVGLAQTTNECGAGAFKWWHVTIPSVSRPMLHHNAVSRPR